MKISVIVPALNEGREIEGCLVSLRQNFKGEILVVDGGSSDDTVEKALVHTNKVLHGPRGLANQCNFGAQRATGDVLFFVASDVRLTPRWSGAITEALRSPYVAGGGFRLHIQGHGLFFKLITWGGNLRGRIGRFSLPDQGLFVRRALFDELQGFSVTSRIAFAEFCYRLRSRGEFIFLNEWAYSSPRKWMTHGKWKTTFRHVKTYFEFLLAEIWGGGAR